MLIWGSGGAVSGKEYLTSRGSEMAVSDLVSVSVPPIVAPTVVRYEVTISGLLGNALTIKGPARSDVWHCSDYCSARSSLFEVSDLLLRTSAQRMVGHICEYERACSNVMPHCVRTTFTSPHLPAFS